MGPAGNGSRGSCGGIRLCVQVRPVVRVSRAAVPLAAFIPSRAGAGAGDAWGGFASGERSGGVNQDSARAARGGGAENRATSRLAAGQGKAVHAARAGGVTGGASSGVRARQRIWPSRIP
jgi:hypothetical protein